MEDPCSSAATGSPGPLQGRSDGADLEVGGVEACKLSVENVDHEGLCVGVCDEELCSKAAVDFLSLRSNSGYPFQDGDEPLDDAVYGGNGEPLLSKKAPDEWARGDLANIVFGLKTEEEELFDNVDRFLCERDLFETGGAKAPAPFSEAGASADADATDADAATSESAAPPPEDPQEPTLSEAGPSSQPPLVIPGPSGIRARSFPCPVEGCDRVFERNRQLRVHLISHTTHRPFKCPVDDCDWAFATEYKLKRHLETHQGKKAFTCEVDGCGQSFTTVYNLRSHMKLHGRPTFSCPGCGQSFGTRRKMELHLREHKELDAPYRCPEAGCGKAYYSSNTLASHLRVHQHRPEELRCPFSECGRQFGRACKLRLHVRQHTGERPYGCPVSECAWTFASASKLTRHMRKHTGDRRYLCPDCGKAFMRPEHLRGHMVVHSGGRPFACTQPGCSSRFAAKSSLYVHLKKHAQGGTERLVYACPVGSCARRFLSRGALCQHIERCHSLVVLDGPSREEEEAAAVASVSSSRPSSPDLLTGLVQENQSGAARTDYAHHGHHRLLPGAVDVVLTSSATTPLQQEEAPGDLYAGLSVLAEHTDIGTTIRLQDFD